MIVLQSVFIHTQAKKLEDIFRKAYYLLLLSQFMANSELDELIAYWQKIHDDLLYWYNIADTKSSGIISLNAMLLGFVTISAFVNPSSAAHNEISQVETLVLVGLLCSVMTSVICAVCVLWSRISIGLYSKVRKPYEIHNRDLNTVKYKNEKIPPIFFAHIAERYHKEEGYKFFQNEITKYKSKENYIQALASQITILSSNLVTKFFWINVSYIFIFISIVLLSIFTLFKFVLN